ncbi:uncharacterized protein LOC115454257 isoform X2 [Manduca sexta]|uniref:uncharacterized protein LOC115454257 isoform X2 n=1 Tax=Manduca sexta TaxID=7130 RepID=UPI00188F1C74|nr:uncharacterized protein LOC115454257 isoform X2 [Manduca sexta]
MNSVILAPQLSKYRISRRGRKLQIFDDQRTLLALPKDVPERTWAEILQREENDLIVYDIREEIVEEALRIGYESYMNKQTALFTAHVAAKAWLKLIDWHFYRHDPGEDPSAYPPCFIPKRVESWMPDELPDPSPKDTWCHQQLNVVEDATDEGFPQVSTSSSSLEYPVVEEIPQEYWFPGKVNLPHLLVQERLDMSGSVEGRRRPPVEAPCPWDVSESPRSEALGADSELLQKVTDYSTEDLLKKESTYSALKTTTPVEGSLQGAGDSAVPRARRRTGPDKSKVFSKARLDTQYEVSSEKVDTPPGEMVKRK